ncbi:MAG: hypothetical protein IT537_12810 [Hyphomicrobiales bacterium]|nr:hypothetical protein [Hyphomicrobiales bacterium]
MPTRRALLAALAATAALPARAQPGSPSNWPDRPITLVHGLAPGGPSDIIARIMAEGLSRRLGQQVVVDARPGAGGRVAAAQIARTAPDGYTLMSIPSGHAVSAAIYKSLNDRTIDDFAMISLLTGQDDRRDLSACALPRQRTGDHRQAECRGRKCAGRARHGRAHQSATCRARRRRRRSRAASAPTWRNGPRS